MSQKAAENISRFDMYLLIDPDSIQSCIHNVHPTVARRQNKKWHESFAKIVKVVFAIEPNVSFVSETIGFVSHLLYVRTIAIKKCTLEELNSEDTKDYEEGTAYENNVADWTQRWEQRLNDEL